ncbi:MAG: MTH938/NDUFAF3 family protein [bacterium]|jgi:hypothetical protein
MIEDYHFGSITVNGRTYTNDIKIVGGEVVPDWWRIEGHKLAVADIQDILKAKPDVLVVGKGDPGLMDVTPETERRLQELDILLIAKPTAEAKETYNSLLGQRRVAFAAHLTC